MRERVPIVAAALLCLLASTVPLRAQSPDPDRIAKVQAAYLLNFVRYTRWPDAVFADDTSPVKIVVVGEPRLLPYVRAIVRGEEVEGRRIEVESLPAPEDDEAEATLEAARRAQLLFLPAEHDRLARELVPQLRGRPVVTVSDTPGFARTGGAIELAVDDGRLVFDANATVLEASGAKLSSKALSLAREVVEEPKP